MSSNEMSTVPPPARVHVRHTEVLPAVHSCVVQQNTRKNATLANALNAQSDVMSVLRLFDSVCTKSPWKKAARNPVLTRHPNADITIVMTLGPAYVRETRSE